MREQAPGVFHIYARGNGGQIIFRDDFDRRRYLVLLGRAARHHGWHVLTYCLMSNHVHLVIETERENLAAGMQRLHGTYAQGFNMRHELFGHLFQGRYGSIRITTDAQLWAAVRYVVRNPVEAGMCEHPDEYEWSSYGPTVRGEVHDFLDASRLLSLLDRPGSPIDRYAEFVSDGPFLKGLTL